jgi:hypothetical protein
MPPLFKAETKVELKLDCSLLSTFKSSNLLKKVIANKLIVFPNGYVYMENNS